MALTSTNGRNMALVLQLRLFTPTTVGPRDGQAMSKGNLLHAPWLTCAFPNYCRELNRVSRTDILFNCALLYCSEMYKMSMWEKRTQPRDSHLSNLRTLGDASAPWDPHQLSSEPREHVSMCSQTAIKMLLHFPESGQGHFQEVWMHFEASTRSRMSGLALRSSSTDWTSTCSLAENSPPP